YCITKDRFDPSLPAHLSESLVFARPIPKQCMTDRKPSIPLFESPQGWTPSSWTQRVASEPFSYPDAGALILARQRLAQLPPLVTSWEIEKLRLQIAQAQTGKRFILQGGDCAEMIADCRSEPIANKLKILLQM